MSTVHSSSPPPAPLTPADRRQQQQGGGQSASNTERARYWDTPINPLLLRFVTWGVVVVVVAGIVVSGKATEREGEVQDRKWPSAHVSSIH